MGVGNYTKVSPPIFSRRWSTDYIVRKYQAFARLAKTIEDGEYETRVAKNPVLVGDDIAVFADLVNFHLFTGYEVFVIDCECDTELHSLVSDATSR